MARYELDTQVREVLRDGATIVTREGTRGRTATEHERSYDTALVARHHASEYGRALVATGYHHVDPTRFDDRDIPEDDGARIVHADVLLLRGDPRGELIVMQARGVDPTAVLAAHADRWYGELADAWRYLDVTWRLGWLQRVSVGPSVGLRTLMPELSPWHHLPTILEALFELPIARALEELAIRDLAANHAPYVLAATAQAPRTLRTLALDCELDITTLTSLLTMPWPRLCTLALGIQRGAVNALTVSLAQRRSLPELTHLVVTTQEPTVLANAITMAQLDLDVLIRGDDDIDARALRPNIRYERR